MKKKLRFLIFTFILILGSGCTIHSRAVGKEPLIDKSSYSGMNVEWMAVLYEQNPPTDAVIKEIEKRTNTKLDMIWVPDAIKEDRLNMAFASGKLPKIVTLTDLKASSVQHSLRSGMFWELGPYLKDYPNLKEMNEIILNNISVEGKVYGIYRERPISRQGVVIRTDWLRNLGLSMPTSINELYEVARAFTYHDPDGNGMDDTIGFTDRNDLTYGIFKTLASYMGTPNEWGVINNQIIPDFETEPYWNTMHFMKTLYDEKLMNQDFTITSKKQQQDLFVTGKAGIYIGNMVDGIYMRNEAVKLNPSFEMDFTNRIKGPDGKLNVWAIGGQNGMFAIPKTSVKTEEELKKILAFLDRMAEEDIVSLLEIGIEGIHHIKKDDGTYEMLAENKELYERDVKPLLTLKSIGNQELLNKNEPLRMKFDTLVKDNETFAVMNPTEGLFSPTYTEYGSEIRKIIDNATFHFIIGEMNEEEFHSEIRRWRENGGNQIIEEFNEELVK
ncbi:extracellular solute-binding protein [Bacillus sp. AK128]